MKFIVTAAAILIVGGTDFIVKGAHAFHGADFLFPHLQKEDDATDDIDEAVVAAAAAGNAHGNLVGLNNIAMSVERQKDGLDNIKESLQKIARGIAGRDNPYAVLPDLSSPTREALSKEEIENIIKDVVERLNSRLFRYGKRGWNTFSVEPRFASIGTKLVPNRKLDNGGATLLRYGRSPEQL